MSAVRLPAEMEERPAAPARTSKQKPDPRLTKAGEVAMALKPREKTFIEQTTAIRALSASERGEVGFSTRLLVQCSLPHRDPGSERTVWTRSNGNVYMSIQPKRYIRNGREYCVGYPYGSIPRLLLAYVCSEAVRKRSCEITLGQSMSEFMRQINLDADGRTIRRLKDQTRRLFSSYIDFTYDDGKITRDLKANLVSQIHLWHDNINPYQKSFFESYIILTKEFYNEIIEHPVPMDMGIINAIKQSPLALDLYAWLTYRVSYLRAPVNISWAALAMQVGSEYENTKELGRKVKESLRRIVVLWPDLRIEEIRGGLRLLPASRPSLPRRETPRHP